VGCCFWFAGSSLETSPEIANGWKRAGSDGRGGNDGGVGNGGGASGADKNERGEFVLVAESSLLNSDDVDVIGTMLSMRVASRGLVVLISDP